MEASVLPNNVGKICEDTKEKRKMIKVNMSKEELLDRLDPETLNYWNTLIAYGYAEAEAADFLYNHSQICYWERDILKGE